jgi:hypothetical protein
MYTPQGQYQCFLIFNSIQDNTKIVASTSSIQDHHHTRRHTSYMANFHRRLEDPFLVFLFSPWLLLWLRRLLCLLWLPWLWLLRSLRACPQSSFDPRPQLPLQFRFVNSTWAPLHPLWPFPCL